MSSVRQFPVPASSPTEAYSSPQAEGVAESILVLFKKLPLADQQLLVARMTKSVQLIPATRAGDVLGTVVRFLPKRPKWTAEEIRSEVSAAGVSASSRDVFNAIGYLAKKGLVQRLGAGRYLINGVGLQSAGDEWVLPGDPRGDCGDGY